MFFNMGEGENAMTMMYERFRLITALAVILQVAGLAQAQTGPAPAAVEGRVILTPKPAREPHINGPKVYGVRPGKPFLFRIPATGERPMRFAVRQLPEGLSLDPQTGIIAGRIRSGKKKTYRTTLVAENAAGKVEREFRIVVGDTIALTPPMGWNSGYLFCDRITDADMRCVADIMVKSGMADCGYQYVNVNDCWMKKRGDEPYRDAEGALLPNPRTFPDMKGMCDYIHAKGLKPGGYTVPGSWTCTGTPGSLGHEAAERPPAGPMGLRLLEAGHVFLLRGVSPGEPDARAGAETGPALRRPIEKTRPQHGL